MAKQAARVMVLDKATCELLTPEVRKYRVTDAEHTPLKFTVEPNGRKHWTTRYVTASGKNSETSLGTWPKVLRAAAVKGMKRAHGQVADKVDPVEEKRAGKRVGKAERAQAAESRSRTFAWLAGLYFDASEQGFFGHKGGRKAASTVAKERQHFDKHLLPRLGSWALDTITHEDLVGVLEDVLADSRVRSRVSDADFRGYGAANSCLEVIRRVFAYGRYKRLIAANPTLELSRYGSSKPRRDVVANEAALRTLWTELEGAKKDAPNGTAAALQLSILTLQRRGEVVAIRRSEVDLEKALWTIPAMNKKERRKGLVPLSASALKILSDAFEASEREAKRHAGRKKASTDVWAFPGATPDVHLEAKTLTRFMARLRGGPPKSKARKGARPKRASPEEAARREALRTHREALSEALDRLTPHDLRRTGRTVLTGELSIDEATAERVLNHTVGSAQANAYDWNAYLPQKRAALDAWAGWVWQVATGEARTSNIVPIRA